MIYLAAKAPGERLDYQLDMTEFVPAGFSIDTVTVEVTMAGNTESPVALVAADFSALPLTEDAENNLGVLFWLTGGTAGVRYRGVIAMSDNESTGATDREYRRLFEVEIKDL